MDLVATLRKTAQIARERDQLTALPEGMERAADRIEKLEAALREIKTRTYAYRGDDQNYPLAAGVYEVANAALQAR